VVRLQSDDLPCQRRAAAAGQRCGCAGAANLVEPPVLLLCMPKYLALYNYET